MEIKLVDLSRQYKKIKKELNEAVNRVLSKGDFILGNQVSIFEKEYAKYCNTKYAIGVASGLDALRLTLIALNIKAGDEVIIPANTFIATALAISSIGAIPVLVDINPDTYLIEANQIKKYIRKKTKAIIPVHLYGQCCEMDEIVAVSEKYGIPVIEDACQAHGASIDNRKAGSFSIAGCFSFYPGKNLGAYGDGGIIVTNSKKLYNIVKILRNYGQSKKYYHIFQGYNSRLDTIQAAILNVKLKYLNEDNEKRRKMAALYNKLLADNNNIICPYNKPDHYHVYHLYVIRTKNRNKLFEFLIKNKIYAGIHYPVPIHMQKAYTCLGYSKGFFPVTEKISKEILSLPMFPDLNQREVVYIVNTINQFYKKYKLK